MNNKQGLDYIKTLNVISANQWSDPLPAGHYLGLELMFYGTHSGSVDPADALGQVRVNIAGLGDIVNVSAVNLQTINNFLGGRPESTAGTDFYASCIIPFTLFGLPNALYIGNKDSVKVFVQKCQTTATAMSCEISGIYGNAPENFIPIISQDRYNSLGGLATEFVAVKNLVAIWLKQATTTDPDLISLESNYFSNSFSWKSGQFYSDLAFNVESTTLGSILIPVLNTDVADAINDMVRLKFSGGSGVMDFVTISAHFNRSRLSYTRQLIKAYRTEMYRKLAISSRSLPADKPYGLDEDALLSAGDVG